MSDGTSVSEPRFWRNAALLFLVLGVGWRVLRYLLQFPIWGDEAFICLNFLDRDLLGLLRPLRYVQVAPILFLWSEWATYQVLGGGELALRLLPSLASLGSLFIFWRLTRLVLSPAASAIALGILAVAYYPVRHGCEVKPYAFDLFFALALLLAAASWLHQPERKGWLFALVVLVPLALGLSYPAIFMAGAVSAALLPTVWRLREKKTWCLYAAYNSLMLLSFLGVYLAAGTGQYDSTGGSQNFYWTDWFPPAQPLALLKWLALAHTGNMMAYPVGGRDGASAATFLLCLGGIVHLARRRQGSLLLLLLGPFVLTFVAAALHRYPYGGSARIAQHLAPAICLLAGTGLAMCLGVVAQRYGQDRRIALVVCLLLAVVGIAGMVRDVKKPYKTEGDRMVRLIVNDAVRRAAPDDQIVVLDQDSCVGATFEWYLRRHPERVQWNADVDWPRLGRRGDLWGFSFRRDGASRSALESQLLQCPRPMLLIDHQVYDLQLGQSDETLEHCEVFHWRPMYGE
jgi:4-amino-4-deoxy-L-arabinose transferase-like glycosyltransferase